MAGVLPVSVCTSSTGVAVRRPKRPVELTYRLLLGAPALTVKTWRLAVASSTVKYDAPPEAVSLTRIRQSLAGKVPVLVSSKWMPRLFSLSRIVSKPKDSLLTQSKPAHRLPCTIRSSGTTWSFVVKVLPVLVGGTGAPGSVASTTTWP